MKSKQLNISSEDEIDDFFQSLSLSELKNIVRESKTTISNSSLKEISNEDDYLDIDSYIQSMQLSELKEIAKNSDLLQKINKSSVKHKSKITGLDEQIIILIETKKEKATLEQLLIYCEKLHIPFRNIVPEVFFKY